MDYEIDYEYGVALDDGYFINAKPYSKKEIQYTFYQDNKEKNNIKYNRIPQELTLQTKVGKEIKSHMNLDYKNHVITNNFRIITENLQQVYELNQEIIQEAEAQEKETELMKDKEICEKGLALFNNTVNPLVYIGSLIEWCTAGERRNILLTFLCFSSQIILKHPISVIGLGDGSSGKTHVQSVALSMIPDEYILYEKKPTLAAMFRRAEVNQKYYDGKIVVYGDMGGASDLDEVEETKNLLKELQTDGYLSRPITIKVDGEFTVVDLILQGYPCLTYTTVPSYDFDDQELSRSFTYTPRTDNKQVFNKRKSYLELKGGYTESLYQNMQSELEQIKLMMKGLKCKFEEDIVIVNIYTDIILDFIGNSDYYKRDFDKFNSILKCITVFNSQGRETYNINGRDVLFVEPIDIILFLSLIDSYTESIGANLPLKAGEIYNNIVSNIDSICSSISADSPENVIKGFTISEYMDKCRVDIPKRTVQYYFKELNNHGYLRVVGNEGRSNVYCLNREVNTNTIDLTNYIPLSEDKRATLYSEYPSEIIDDVLAHDVLSDELLANVNIMNQHREVIRPPWCDYDN